MIQINPLDLPDLYFILNPLVNELLWLAMKYWGFFCFLAVKGFTLSDIRCPGWRQEHVYTQWKDMMVVQCTVHVIYCKHHHYSEEYDTRIVYSTES